MKYQINRTELPMMMVTAYSDDERRRRASWAPAEFLTKRVDFDLLRVRLRITQCR
jgi:hypothetical protein